MPEAELVEVCLKMVRFDAAVMRAEQPRLHVRELQMHDWQYGARTLLSALGDGLKVIASRGKSG